MNRKATLKKDLIDPFAGVQPANSEVSVEGLWKDVTGVSWMQTRGNPAASNYKQRSEFEKLPVDDNVYYGKIRGLGFLIHESELEFN